MNRLLHSSRHVRFTHTQQASRLLDIFPGSTPLQRSSSVLLAVSAGAFLVSKEIYLIDAEFMEMLCIFGAYYLLWSGGKDGAAGYFKERRDKIKSVLVNARAAHMDVVKERIDHVGKMSGVVEETKELFAVSRVSFPFHSHLYNLL